MKVLDARRLTGLNLQTEGPAAICEVEFAADDDVALAEAAWRDAVASLLNLVGLPERPLTVRYFETSGAWLVEAPIDELYATVTVNDWACSVAMERLGGECARPINEVAELVKTELEEERDARLLQVQHEAALRGVPFLWDDDFVSLGYGKNCKTWERTSLPEVDALDWSYFGTIPVFLITGTNGKTTTSRMLARIFKFAGLNPGTSSTDGLYVGEEAVELGDWTGPGAARTILRHPEVDVAILETARGGILRRGLGVVNVDGALVTNISSDHLGEYGITSLELMAKAKGRVYGAVRNGGISVFNIDDPHVAALAPESDPQSVWTSTKRVDSKIQTHLECGGRAVYLADGDIVMARGSDVQVLMSIADIPCAFGGTARYNVANAISAAALAESHGISPDAIRAGLTSFGANWLDNPGRGQLTEVNGVKVMLDFGHNPDGVKALLDVVNDLLDRGESRGRLSVCVGQAGDRSDQDIFELAEAITAGNPSKLYLRSMKGYLRGRDEGEVPRVFREAFVKTGVQPEIVSEVSDEVEALKDAMTWAEPGDLILHLVHLERQPVESYLSHLGARL